MPMKNTPETEYIYIFSNPSFPEFIKIGRTQNVQKRLQTLSTNTAIPLPFECIYACEVSNASKVERTLHTTFEANRVAPNREFFRMEPEPAIAILELVSVNTLKPEVFNRSKHIAERDFLEKMHNEFTFDQAKVPLGSLIKFSRDAKIQGHVTGKNMIDINGATMTLLNATKDALKQSGQKTHVTISPSRYWLFQGEVLAHRKHQNLYSRY